MSNGHAISKKESQSPHFSGARPFCVIGTVHHDHGWRGRRDGKIRRKRLLSAIAETFVCESSSNDKPSFQTLARKALKPSPAMTFDGAAEWFSK
jgi:hypothetical protein